MEKKNVLICDANHGGLVLLEEYHKYTKNNLFFYDIYNKLSNNQKEKISNKFNVTFLDLEEILDNEESYITIAPIHMPPVINVDYTHHEFVSYLLKKMNVKGKLIQVTGVKGKTTVTSLIKDVLKDYNILSLTSENLTYNNEILLEKLSIAPSSIITAFNKAKELGVLEDIDYCVFEVSLGVIPGGHIGILTNIIENYPIAKNSSNAVEAKESIFTSNIAICDYESYSTYYNSHDNVITVSLNDDNADVYAYNINYDMENTTFCLRYMDNNFTVKHFALSDFYINNLLFAITVALMIDMDIEDIISRLGNDGVDGRNSYRYINDKLIIEDINPGLNTSSIKKCIDNLERLFDEYDIIIGGDYGITCEEIDEVKLCDYLEQLDNENIIFTGELGHNLSNSLDNDYIYFKELNEAVKDCLMKDHNVIQIIYRSEYNSNKEKILKII
jgi:UDP-N-acetylmuramyl pentapeptide synthase